MKPLPSEFLDWQVELRRWTVSERRGMPHPGVMPLVLVPNGDHEAGVAAHSIVCGLLPRADLLEAKTKEFRTLYEEASPLGKDELFERGLAYLAGYYAGSDVFDPASLTTLIPADSTLARALADDPTCALLFHVFEMGDGTRDKAPGGDVRCQQLACRAELLRDGPVHDNVWWHNALFHGSAEGHVVVRFRHARSYDTAFGRLEVIRDAT